MDILLIKKQGPLMPDTRWEDLKDPCPVFDGKTWHLFGSGGNVAVEQWKIFHATAPNVYGPWTECPPAELIGVKGNHVAAPGVIFDENEKTFHMFIQTEFLSVGGSIEYLTSVDGAVFEKKDSVLRSIPLSSEAGIYDPHPAVIGSQKYIVYSGIPHVETSAYYRIMPDIYLARSINNSWHGPWERMGRILSHTEIAMHHNQIESLDYEWGIEGAQLIELDHGQILLNATCFLPTGSLGKRQRVFFALADMVTGPYKTLGTVLNAPFEPWESGENGHATGIKQGNELLLFYQARPYQNTPVPQPGNWRYGIATFDLKP